MRRRLGDALLNIAAVLGAVSIVLVILAVVFDVSIMLFRTGSMGPAIPAGSIAFVQEIPAVEMEIGDVVTVSRGEGVLPVTHRVTAIHAVDGADVTFAMQGDANSVADPSPYTADTVRRVLFSVPGLAGVVQSLGHPLVLGGLTLVAASLVVWAFWPRDGGGVGPESADGHDQSTDLDVSTPKRGVLRVAVVIVPVLALGAVAFPAMADRPIPVETGDYLQLTASGDAQAMRNLSPGSSAAWTVRVGAEAPGPGVIALSVTAEPIGSRSVSESLSITVAACAAEWTEKQCPGGSETLLSPMTVGNMASPLEFLSFSSDEERWVRVLATLEEDRASGSAGGAGVRIFLHAHGDGTADGGSSSRPGPGLPQTGYGGGNVG